MRVLTVMMKRSWF